MSRIEECVKSLLEMSQGLTGQYPQFHDPGDALDHVAEKRLLEKTACFDPEADEINKLLRHVVSWAQTYLILRLNEVIQQLQYL